MRTKDVRVGGTYVVNVPQRIPAAIRDSVPSTAEAFAAHMQLHLNRGRRFDLTVTDVHRAERTVDGIEPVTTSKVGLPLSEGQVRALGLPEGVPHRGPGLRGGQ
ncbi:hypothetical protein [Streptomyces melanogenes]|uniref:hypothetical protein n=1 Tax=Streptomyces melanogenes TaxID=67326 RepID=UPI00167EB484|nr:hypothetical protein [Streptomyces melanogenes]GGP80165.1 hypothetical protein GCM10010278_68280 [Streptomyces melanogenes]